MSEAAGPARRVFEPKTVAAVLAAGIVAFVLFLLLMAYADDFRTERDGRAHALSASAVGFKGLVRLIELSGGKPQLLRSEDDHDGEDLLLVFVEERTDEARLEALLERRATKPTLVILPKWNVLPDPERPAWVRRAGVKDPRTLGRPSGRLSDIWIRHAAKPAQAAAGLDLLEGYSAAAPRPLQTLSGKHLTPLLAAGRDAVALARVGEGPLYLLAEPDLLNNQGLKDAGRARAALTLLDELNATGAGSVAFDVTLNGFGRSPNPLKLAFEAPFLPLTLALFAAALLAGLHGAFRFGPVAEEPRAIAFGKGALVENSAALFKIAGREHAAGGGYAELIRESAAHESGAHLALREGELDAYLDRVSPPDRPPFSALAERARQARDRIDLVAAARALFQWKKDLIK